MLIDDIKIRVQAGKGGNGMAAFNKTKMNLGPTGGNGGNGGNIYIEGITDLGSLIQFRYKKDIKAEKGKNAKGRDDGAGGKDLVLKVPVGTVVHNLTNGKNFEIVSMGQKIFLAKGGIGGKGNYFFKSSTNTTPIEFEDGTPGEEFELRLELKLIADVGLVGLPNAGKSSLLNRLTNARSKVANYPFTTLNPNLGVYYELILADIPGLIEGASKGKGLGDKFLRHIERTKTIFHLVSCESQDPAEDYQTIRNELGAYNKDLLLKQEYVFLSKSDELAKEELEEKLKALRKKVPQTIPISIIDDKSIEQVEIILRKLIEKKRELEAPAKDQE
jgi:GTPase